MLALTLVNAKESFSATSSTTKASVFQLEKPNQSPSLLQHPPRTALDIDTEGQMDRSCSSSLRETRGQDGAVRSSMRPEHMQTAPFATPDESSHGHPAYFVSSNQGPSRDNVIPYQAPPRFQPQNRQVSHPVIYDTAQNLSHQSLPQPPFHVNRSSGPRGFDVTQSHQQNAGLISDQHLSLQRDGYNSVSQLTLMQPRVADRATLAPTFAPTIHNPIPRVFLGGPNPGFLFGNFQGYRHVIADAASEGSTRSSSTYGGTSSASLSQVSSASSSQSSPHSFRPVAGNVSVSEGHLRVVSKNPTFYLDYLRFSAAHGKENVVHMHYTLDAQFHRPFSWAVDADPFEATYDGKRLPLNTFHEAAFIPAKSTAIIVVGFNSGEARSSNYTASLQPEVGQRLVGFPISGNTAVGHQETQAQSGTQKTSSLHRDSESTLDLHTVFNGIRNGMRAAIPEECWRALNVREKFVLATRLSARRADKLSGLDFLYAAIELEVKSTKLEGVEQVADALREAHARLDAYAFGKGGPGGQRDCVRIIDFLGGKTTFNGLRWMGWKPVADAFFLCVA